MPLLDARNDQLDDAASTLRSVLRESPRDLGALPPHHGLINLPLLVRDPAWLRVGKQTQYWKKGERLIFNDSIEHEASNQPAETRVVFLFDTWRPELSGWDRAHVTKRPGAIAHYCGEAIASRS